MEPTPRGFSLAAARERCRELAMRHEQHRDDGGLRGARFSERKRLAQVRPEQRLAQAVAAASATERARHSLAALLDEYVRLQRSKRRISARLAESIFDRHVVEAWLAIALAPACDLSQEQVVNMLRRLVEQGKGRTSDD